MYVQYNMTRASMENAHTPGRLAVVMADRQLLQLGKQHGVEPQLAPKQRSMTAFFSKAEPSAHNNAVAAEMAAGREQALVKRAAEAAVAEEAAKALCHV